ncbi:hypothetical protein EGW08_010449, partial [Elysia chlorotica]
MPQATLPSSLSPAPSLRLCRAPSVSSLSGSSLSKPRVEQWEQRKHPCEERDASVSGTLLKTFPSQCLERTQPDNLTMKFIDKERSLIRAAMFPEVIEKQPCLFKPYREDLEAEKQQTHNFSGSPRHHINDSFQAETHETSAKVTSNLPTQPSPGLSYDHCMSSHHYHTPSKPNSRYEARTPKDWYQNEPTNTEGGNRFFRNCDPRAYTLHRYSNVSSVEPRGVHNKARNLGNASVFSSRQVQYGAQDNEIPVYTGALRNERLTNLLPTTHSDAVSHHQYGGSQMGSL